MFQLLKLIKIVIKRTFSKRTERKDRKDGSDNFFHLCDKFQRIRLVYLAFTLGPANR